MKRGCISFCGFDHEETKHAPYLIASNTQVSDVKRGDVTRDDVTQDDVVVGMACEGWKWMLKEYALPKLIISVTGGAMWFKLDLKHLESFKRGLIKVATTTDTWIVTGGTRSGVMRVVGDSVRDYMLEGGAYKQALVVIGIATFGVVEHHQALAQSASESNPCTCYAYHNIEDDSGDDDVFKTDGDTTKKKKGKSICASLDPHHTHFLLADDGSRDKFGREIELRAAFEQHKHEVEDPNADKCGVERGVAVVLLMLEGGINTLKTVAESMERGTPVVVMAGSGRAADFLARADGFLRTNDMEGLRKDAEICLGEKEMHRAIAYITSILQPSNHDLITIFIQTNDTTGEEFAEVILKAILKASLHSKAGKLTQASAVSFLDLALSFNRPHIAKEEICEHRDKLVFHPHTITTFFLASIKHNNPSFVHLFMQMSSDLVTSLTYQQLNKLYLQTLQDARTGSCEEILHSYIFTLANNEENALMGVSKVVSKITDYQLTDLYTESCMNSTCHLKYPVRDLWLMCVILHRPQMAQIFWKLSHCPIGSALLASRLSRTLSDKVLHKYESFELARLLAVEARVYEENARSVLREGCRLNNHGAKLLLVRSLKEWGGLSVFEIVEESKLMLFAEDDCCQTQLSLIWYGNLMSHTPTWMIFLGLFFPFFMVFFMHFRQPHNKITSIQSKYLHPHSSIHPSTSSSHPSTSSFPPSNPPSHSFTSKTTKSRVSSITSVFSDDQSFVHHSSFLQSKPAFIQSALPTKTTLHATTSIPIDASLDSPRTFHHQAINNNNHSTYNNKCHNYYNKLYYFFNSPIVKFSYYTLSYTGFLVLFCYFLLADFSAFNITWSEVMVYVWVTLWWLDEFRQISCQSSPSLMMKIYKHFSDRWNIYEQVISVSFIVVIILRLTLPASDSLITHDFLAILLLLCILKLLRFFYVQRYIGPKVIMIQEMIFDLLFFLLIFLIFLIAYGVTSYAFLYPTAPPSWHIIVKVLYEPYFALFGEFNLEELQGKVEDCVTNHTAYLENPRLYPLCPRYSPLTLLLFSAYAITTCVMLVNLLVAIFSYTFTIIQESGLRTWQFYRIGLIREFSHTPPLPPPFSIFSLIFIIARYVFRWCTGSTNRQRALNNNEFRVVYNDEEDKRRCALERRALKEYFNNKKCSI